MEYKVEPSREIKTENTGSKTHTNPSIKMTSSFIA